MFKERRGFGGISKFKLDCQTDLLWTRTFSAETILLKAASFSSWRPSGDGRRRDQSRRK
jgi:hypothetical protein